MHPEYLVSNWGKKDTEELDKEAEDQGTKKAKKLDKDQLEYWERAIDDQVNQMKNEEAKEKA